MACTTTLITSRVASIAVDDVDDSDSDELFDDDDRDTMSTGGGRGYWMERPRAPVPPEPAQVLLPTHLEHAPPLATTILSDLAKAAAALVASTSPSANTAVSAVAADNGARHGASSLPLSRGATPPALAAARQRAQEAHAAAEAAAVRAHEAEARAATASAAATVAHAAAEAHRTEREREGWGVRVPRSSVLADLGSGWQDADLGSDDASDEEIAPPAPSTSLRPVFTNWRPDDPRCCARRRYCPTCASDRTRTPRCAQWRRLG